MWQSQWLRRPCAQPELLNLVAKPKPSSPPSRCCSLSDAGAGTPKKSTTRTLGHGRLPPGVSWGTEDGPPNCSGARKTAATRKSLGHGKPPRAGYPWGTENRREPEIPGARKTSTRISLGHGRRKPGYPWVTENEHEVGWGDGRLAKLHYDRGRCVRC